MNKNPSLQKKSAARMAAVQLLYRQSITGESATPEKQIAQLKKELAGNRSEQKQILGQALEPDYKLAEQLVAGVLEHKDEINDRVEANLSGSWKQERMSPLLIAMLQCAIFEMNFHKDLGFKIVIDEYTRLARHFFADAEVNFLHGFLSGQAPQ